MGFLGLHVCIPFSWKSYSGLAAEAAASLKLHVQKHDVGGRLKKVTLTSLDFVFIIDDRLIDLIQVGIQGPQTHLSDYAFHLPLC